MPLKPPELTFTDIARHPLVYALIIMATLLGVFVTATMSQNSDSVLRLEREKNAWKALYIKERADKEALTKELLIRNGVISALPAVVDSIVKAQ